VASSAVSLEVGEIVVYGPEGFARVDGVEEREILGKPVTVVDLFVMDANMRVSVPIDRALERGLRPVSSVEDAEGALETLASHFDTPIPWNRDGRLVKDRYAEGNLDAMVEVISTLLDVESTRRLNDGQRNLLDRARKAFSREIGAALSVEPEDAELRIDAAAVQRRAAAPPPAPPAE
jgi:CarD family transcriptional regulator